MFSLRDLPKYEAIRARADRYPEVDPGAVEAFLTLMRVGTDVETALEKFLSYYRLSLGSFTVLMVLNRDPGIPLMPSELADKCGVTRATITGLLDGLGRKKFVRRDRQTKDRRTVRVRLTSTGIDLLDEFGHEYYRRLSLLMRNLTEDDKRKLSQMLLTVASETEQVSRPVRPSQAVLPVTNDIEPKPVSEILQPVSM
jgi:DNA-binding MarR family transcriptional regulator